MTVHDVIIVGAGQAGLGLSYELTEAGVEHLVLEKGEIGRAWREDRWDSFGLVTPNWSITLPGAVYDGDDPDGFISLHEFIDHLERWAARFDAPVRTGVEVMKVSRDGDAFLLETTDGAYCARQVVLATATYQRPRRPAFAAAITGDVAQFDAAAYRNPAALPAGAVLVVGSGATGAQIAEEVRAAGRETWLAVGRSGRLPRRYRGKDCIAWQRDMGWLDRTPNMLADPARRFGSDPQLTGTGGGRTLSMHDFRAAGMRLTGHVAGVEAGGRALTLRDDLAEGLSFADAYATDFRRAVDDHIRDAGISAPPPTAAEMTGEPPDAAPAPTTPAALDLKAREIGAIIWATGFDFDFSWVDLPVFDRFGYPSSISPAPGLHFMGLNWLPKRKSGIIYGVAENARRLVTTIIETRGR